jgi:hypothetical protein
MIEGEIMISLYCARCASAQPMNQSTTEQEITGPDGETIKLLISTSHCAVCYSFVRSESIHENEEVAA